MQRLRRPIFATLGLIFTGIGIAAAFIPLLPSTGPLLIALFFFARSSPRLEAWILEHEVFGPPIIAWREHGAIPRKAKYMALGGMSIGLISFIYFAKPGPLFLTFGVVLILVSALYVGSRPEGPEEECEG